MSMRSAEVLRALVGCSLLVLGCSNSPRSDSDEGDSHDLPDLPGDLPIESTEYEGIIYGANFDAEPTQFWECESGETFEVAYEDWDSVWEHSCWGVYQRVRGQLDRGYDPPRLLVEETLEARWNRPEDCSFAEGPDYQSCAMASCQPVEACGRIDHRCSPVRFVNATEYAGWKTFDCVPMSEHAHSGPLDVCKYSGDMDTCVDTYRCWNPEGDLTQIGMCVPYCDLNDPADPCIGTCVRCSSSDQWGLCMTDCSGEECNVDAFC